VNNTRYPLSAVLNGEADCFCCIYVLYAGDTPLYVGKTALSAGVRLLDHVRSSDLVGQYYDANRPDSDNWQVAFVPMEERALLTVEKRMIGELRPCFNSAHNPNPRPLPAGVREFVSFAERCPPAILNFGSLT